MEGSTMMLQRVILLLSFCRMVLTATNLNRNDFPANFMFGTASSAYQYEGAYREDGKGLNTWDTFTHIPGRVEDGSNGDVADDQYHRYLEDIQLMASLGLNAYRFSISWSRILPDGSGKINTAGIQYYNNLIDSLLLNGIQPFVTLYHFDLPQALEDSYGGWLSPQIVADFAAYAEICFEAFGDRVKYWATFNEPDLFVPLGYTLGIYPPARCSAPYGINCINGNSMSEPYLAAHHVLLSHSAAVEKFRETYQKKQGGSIGIVISAPWYEPLEDNQDDWSAVDRILSFQLRWFLDPIVFGDYPPAMRQLVKSRLPPITSELSSKLRGSFDYIGINHYTTLYATSNPPRVPVRSTKLFPESLTYLTGERNGIPIGDSTGMEGLYVVPHGIEKVVEYLNKIYNKPVIIITENGYAESNDATITLQETLNDIRRLRFHNDYMTHLATAIRNGSDVRGYFIWSLLDNFEWTAGYTIRFGLYHVDGVSQHRYSKLSAHWLADILQGTRLPQYSIFNNATSDQGLSL